MSVRKSPTIPKVHFLVRRFFDPARSRLSLLSLKVIQLIRQTNKCKVEIFYSLGLPVVHNYARTNTNPHSPNNTTISSPVIAFPKNSTTFAKVLTNSPFENSAIGNLALSEKGFSADHSSEQVTDSTGVTPGSMESVKITTS